LKARLLRVVETVYDGHFDKPKTKRGMRTIPIGEETAEILAVLRPASVDARDLIFAKSNQTPLDRWNLLRKHLKPAAKKLGLAGVTWHLLRHSHATMLDVVGTPIGTMQALLGHSAPEITREIICTRYRKNNVAQLKAWRGLYLDPSQSPAPQYQEQFIENKVVGAPGFEPGTSCAQGRRATRLRYAPT
jgi:integrase